MLDDRLTPSASWRQPGVSDALLRNNLTPAVEEFIP
jgi:hypothetical protein